ncbi:MAG: hypothetical protein M3R15_28460 [Acidobacteriota bacterium]|nr:hypothetical protein [Acidobacteriota bacterium]
MKRNQTRTLLTPLCAVILVSGSGNVKAQETDVSRIPSQSVTLLSHSKHKDYDQSCFSFEQGVRGDAKLPSRRAFYDLRYGGITDGDNHWFYVAMGGGSKRQLKDLGEMSWSDVYFVPVLLASQVPLTGEVSRSYKAGKLVEISPEGVNVRAVVGHMYVMQVKDNDSDFYAMFRVESLEPNGECTISWKHAPSPE